MLLVIWLNESTSVPSSPSNRRGLWLEGYGVGGEAGPIFASMSQPAYAKYWWPCKDRPDDKAIVEEHWTVRPDWIATGNGLLQGVEIVADRDTREPGNALAEAITPLAD